MTLINGLIQISLIVIILITIQCSWTLAKEIVSSNGVTASIKEPFKFTCPDQKRIAPCTCSVRNSESKVECRGEHVTQEVINLTMLTLRQLNNLESPDDILHITKLKIQSTKMRELNLTPLTNCQFKSVSINFNENLTKLFGPPLKTFDITSSSSILNLNVTEKIRTEELHLESNSLTDKGLSTIFYYIQDNLIKLILSRNKIQAIPHPSLNKDLEFLPNFSALKNLEKLDLSRNKIVKIGGGQFKNNVKLQEINLQWNEIAELSENAFYFNKIESTENGQNSRLLIDLTANTLSDERINSNWFPLDNSSTKIVKVNFAHNKFEFISSKNFKNFLEANEGNFLVFCDSFHCEPRTIICNAKMKWLKDLRIDFEHRLSGLNCTNDRRHTVFNSHLTDLPPSEHYSLCPSADLITPCICEPGHLKVDCRGDQVRQSIINLLVRETLKLNPNERLNLSFHTFTIRRTKLTELDLTQFLGIHFENLAIIKNPNLTKLFVDETKLKINLKNENVNETSQSQSRKSKNEENLDSLLIKVNYLGLNDNALVDEGLGEIFKLFAQSTLTSLNLQNNKIRGSASINPFVLDGSNVTKDAVQEKTQEFLPGFSSMFDLEFLVLSNNKISKVDGGQFRGLSNLRMLDLGHNEIESIGIDGFVLDQKLKKEIQSEILNETMIINLRYNKLKDETIDPSNGLDTIQRPTVVDFSGNKFDTISKSNFNNFLQRNPLNCMYFYFNLFNCDNRVKWLKENRLDFEHRVIPLNCGNDPMQTVFTTNLIQ